MEMGACGSCVRMMLGVEADVKIHVIEPTTQNGPYEQPSFQLVSNDRSTTFLNRSICAVIEPTTQNGPYEQPSFQLVQNGEAVVNERRQNRSTSAPIIVAPPSTTLQVPSLIPGLSIVRD
uniref:Uncharacterized protein n=1 Tax=Plectus sambesii TaxID=2011161 RepID=A0A914UTU8_9BILA